MYTVKQLARLAGVSIRTLHYYDEIGLLKPAEVGHNGYRYYDETTVFRLQQILFFRELKIDLTTVKTLLDRPGFDQVTALQQHRSTLQAEIHRLQTLLHTIDHTIAHLSGEVTMSKKKLFEGFSPEKQQAYEKEAVERWGDTARQSQQRWERYTDQQKQRVLDEGGAIYAELATHLADRPDGPEVQALLGRWHQHLRYFYEPTLEILRGLGNTYHDHPDFNATFTAIHPDLPAFLQKAITCYVDALELAELERELAILEE